MTTVEQIKHLQRMFPRSTELAISPLMLDELLMEMSFVSRYLRLDTFVIYPLEIFPSGLRARRLNLYYRNCTLTVVES